VTAAARGRDNKVRDILLQFGLERIRTIVVLKNGHSTEQAKAPLASAKRSFAQEIDSAFIFWLLGPITQRLVDGGPT